MPENEDNELIINPLDEKSRDLALLKQDLDVNIQQQILVKKRISLIKEVFHEIPNTAPQYAILATQLEMDRIELDELKHREGEIKSKIKEYS